MPSTSSGTSNPSGSSRTRSLVSKILEGRKLKLLPAQDQIKALNNVLASLQAQKSSPLRASSPSLSESASPPSAPRQPGLGVAPQVEKRSFQAAQRRVEKEIGGA